jgi:hypothetical protein
MSLDERNKLLHPKHKTGECLKQKAHKEAILKDLLDMLEDEPELLEFTVVEHAPMSRNQLRQELREAVRKYCE